LEASPVSFSIIGIEQEIQTLRNQCVMLKDVNSQLLQKVKDLELLIQVSFSLSNTLDRDETLESIQKFFKTNFVVDDYTVLLQTANERELEIVSSYGKVLEKKFSSDDADNLLNRLMHQHSPIYLPDLSGQSEYEFHELAYEKSGSLLALPLSPEANRSIGVLNLYRKSMNGFSKAEIGQFQYIATQIASVIDKTILYHHTKELAFTDGLTGIFNRRYFDMRYSREMLRARRYRRNLTVLMIDIDFFKLYNDTLGHLAGDHALRNVAQVLEASLRRADILCRYGGEEFVVILPEIDGKHGQIVGEKLRRAVLAASFDGEQNLPGKHVTISVGVAAFPEHGETAEDILHKADQALYAAKAGGRNQVNVAS